MTGARDIIVESERRLQAAGIASPRAEAEWLTAASLDLARTAVYVHEPPLTVAAVSQIRSRVEQRCAGTSLQYVLGEAYCLAQRLRVAPGVFIPRPETEVLVHEAIAFLQARVREGVARPRVLELGLGSGAISIALAKAVPACAIVGVELSWMALSVALSNRRAHEVEGRLRLVQGDWTHAVRGTFDLVISNPPYVPSSDVDRSVGRTLDDPRMSLDGGPDGRAFHRRLLAEMPRLGAEGGALCMECAEDQAGGLARQMRQSPWARNARIIDDLTGRPRGVWADVSRAA